VFLGHSGAVVIPGSSDRAPAATGTGGDAEKPATEPTADNVTERRRQAALAGHRGNREAATAALRDTAPSVRATALGALDRIGALQDGELVAALADPSPVVRRRASELAATRTGVAVAAALGDEDASVVEMAAWSLGERGERSAVAALSSLAHPGSGHADPLCREAAVAALGAIGDPAGLPAVLAALDDKPAVRRRAAVALAAFEGPDVDQALRRCLDDRDWQVRQVAEDLLALE
jgi:HEAT repeat protein